MLLRKASLRESHHFHRSSYFFALIAANFSISTVILWHSFRRKKAKFLTVQTQKAYQNHYTFQAFQTYIMSEMQKKVLCDLTLKGLKLEWYSHYI